MVRLPIKRGGLGLRSIRESCGSGFIGSVEMSLPFLVEGPKICPHLAPIIGENLSDVRRWELLINSGCRTGEEFAGAWADLKTEAVECTEFIQGELHLPLASDTFDVGEGSCDGSTRHLIVEQRDGLRSLLLLKAL